MVESDDLNGLESGPWLALGLEVVERSPSPVTVEAGQGESSSSTSSPLSSDSKNSILRTSSGLTSVLAEFGR